MDDRLSGALLWVQPCMTTDLYICACGKQQPVAMVARVADAKERMKKVTLESELTEPPGLGVIFFLKKRPDLT